MRVFRAMVVVGAFAASTSVSAQPKEGGPVHTAPAQTGHDRPSPKSTSPARAGGARLLGTAFRTKGGGGEVVLQTSAEVELEPRGGAPGATYVLKGCRILRDNDRRPLDTRFFDSPVTGVTIRARGPDVEVDVSLRASTTAQPRKERGPGNSWYWVLSFPRAASAHGVPVSTGGAAAAANP